MKQDTELTEEEKNALESVPDFTTLSIDELDTDEREISKEEEKEKTIPKMEDKGWSEYVMTQFEEDELDENGNPLVHGLRRVIRKVLGPIIYSNVKVVQAPQMVPGSDKLPMLQPAVVEYTVKILRANNLENGLSQPYMMEFGDAADCYYGNSPSLEFARFLTAMASTRAEARTFRKALQIKTVASEEKSDIPAFEASVDGNISETQIHFIDVLSQRLDVDVVKYINAGTNKYKNVRDVPYGVAAKMVEHLSALQNTPSNINQNIKGYDKKWRKER